MFQVVSESEQRIGIGLLTFTLSCIGLFRGMKWKSKDLPTAGQRVLVGLALTLFICMTSFFHKLYLWPYLFPWVPGARAVRALSRVGLFMLLPLGVGFGRWINSSKLKAPALIAVAAFCVLEQGRSTPSFEFAPYRERIERIAAKVDRDRCRAFYVHTLPKENGEPFLLTHLDAMWASFTTGVPTINGYSGNSPPGWRGFAQEEKNIAENQRRWLSDWLTRNSLSPATICEPANWPRS
jgi:hypothetical protein